MKSTCILLITLFVQPFIVSAQLIDRDPSRLVTGSGIMNTREVEPELIGKTEVFVDFGKGTIFFKNGGLLENTTINYDINRNTLLVLLNKDEFEVKPENVDSAIFTQGERESIFINSRFVVPEEKEVLMQLLHNGVQYKLIKEFKIEVFEPNYNELLNVGSKDYVIARMDRYYKIDNATKETNKFKYNKKSLINLDKSNKLKGDLKMEIIDAEDETRLLYLFKKLEDYNSN
jgi:hypothetical protein